MLTQAKLNKLIKVRQKIRQDLTKNGTNVELNDSDPYGDGDQSVITTGLARQQFYRDLFSNAGDVNYLADVGMAPLSSFAKKCIPGNVSEILELLQKADTDPIHPSEALIQLLEKRETTQRLSPLLMLISMGKNVQLPGVQLPAGFLMTSHLKAVELLLAYGARPDAQDVCGKTVCHYGMGAFATEMTLKAGGYCIAAHESSHLFGKEVELHSLSSTEMNGLRGICRGYIVATGRRMVYLLERKEAVALKPKNLKLVDGDNDAVRPKLCDIQDRLGGVSLIEVLMQERVDVAKVLLEEHHAAIDLVNVEGLSPKSMAIQAGAFSKVGGMIMKSVMRQSRAEHETRQKSCVACGKEDGVSHKCSNCNSVYYCSRECQVAHWRAGHKKECQLIVEESQQTVFLVKPPPGGSCESIVSLANASASAQAPRTAAENFRKPSNVDYGEHFYIKIQGGGLQQPLMIYDRTREFQVQLDPQAPAFRALQAKVAADPNVNGRKTYLKCCLDNPDQCTVFLGTRSVKVW